MVGAMSLDEGLRELIREELARVIELCTPEARREWISMTDLAEALQVSVQTVHAMMKRGCPHIVPDTRPRFNLPEVVAWLAKERTSG